jgi:hypothetical protein
MKNLKIKTLALIAIHFAISDTNLFSQPNFPMPATGDEKGFISIFDGKSLEGWEGDSVYWHVEDEIMKNAVGHFWRFVGK